ncbi:hypothetical protein ACFQ2T_04945 [Methylophilus flavus]|uniref:Uncharacterized protein n=1 Tax=Methylophilus flavus TaxID=640084 RepID=A0ABW3PCF0_9PROT
MKQKQTAILSSAVNGATINTQEAGFLPGMQVVVDLYAPVGAFSGTVKSQTSVDGSTWVDAGTPWVTTAGGLNSQVITLAQFFRIVTTAYASGSVQGRILSDIGG